ncbi:MAG: hypothetical protein JWO80_4533 [Bryobacterales bacterium]|nr:hypothetical protein [Bryobacterales bacterium]
MKLASAFLLAAIGCQAQTLLKYLDVGTACCMAGDAQGNVYMASIGILREDPLVGFFQPISVTKLDASNNIVYRFQFPGVVGQLEFPGGGQPSAIAVNAAGEVFIVGSTSLANFPLVNSIIPSVEGVSSGFVSKVDAAGSRLLFSMILPGPAFVNAIALDPAGNAYVTGSTTNVNFPITSNAFQKSGPKNTAFATSSYAFVTKISSNGNAIPYSTYLGGDAAACRGGSACLPSIGQSSGRAIAIAKDGSMVVAGSTSALDFPVTAGALQTDCKCQFNAPTGFVTSIRSDGTVLNWSTFLGGTQRGAPFAAGDSVRAVALEPDGSPIVAGITATPDFPGAGTNLSGPKFFVSKLNPRGSALVFSSMLESVSGGTFGNLRLDSKGNPWITGNYGSQWVQGGPPFLAQFAADTGRSLITQTFPFSAAGLDLVLDGADRPTVLGNSGSLVRFGSPVPNTPSLFGVTNAARSFVSGNVAPGEILSLYGTGLGPTGGVGAQIDKNGRVTTQLAGVQVTFDGVAAPLLYVSEGQINVVVPFGVTNTTALQVLGPVARSAPLQLTVLASSPAVFSALLNQDGTLNSQTNPALRGSVLTFWLNGAGQLTSEVPDGSILNNPPFPATTLPVSVYISGKEATVLYAGAAPGMVVGIIQVNVQIPDTLPQGATLQVTVDFASAFQTFYAQ